MPIALRAYPNKEVPTTRPGSKPWLRATLSGTGLILTLACGSARDERPTASENPAGGTANVASGGRDAIAGSAALGGNHSSGGSNGGRSGSSAGAGTGGIAGQAGTGFANQAGTSGSGGASGGSGGTPAANGCPAAPPLSGSPCAYPGPCFYQDCAGAGRTSATCGNGVWIIESAPCSAVECGSAPIHCSSEQFCSIAEGGTLSAMCSQSSCGTGLVTCACAHACTDCTIAGNVQYGLSVICSTCPHGGCP